MCCLESTSTPPSPCHSHALPCGRSGTGNGIVECTAEMRAHDAVTCDAAEPAWVKDFSVTADGPEQVRRCKKRWQFRPSLP